MTSLDVLNDINTNSNEISLIQEEDSREVTTIYDSTQESSEVIKYDLNFGNPNNSVNSPMKFCSLSPIEIADAEETGNIYSNSNCTSTGNSRLTSTNSQFSCSGKSSNNLETEYSDIEEVEFSKALDLPKLRSPFSLKISIDSGKEVSSEATTSNNKTVPPTKKRRNRSLRWSYQGQIDTINEVQKQNAMQETQNKLLANDSYKMNSEITLRKMHKRTTSLPYNTVLKVDTNLNNEQTGTNMISLKKRLSPSTFFKTQDDRELKIKQQQQKIKDLELENLKQFSHIQELKFQTSYCIKEIELLKAHNSTLPKAQKQSPVTPIKNNKLSLYIFNIFVLLLVSGALIAYFHQNLQLRAKYLLNSSPSDRLDFLPNVEQLWYSISEKSENFSNKDNSLLDKLKFQIRMIKLVYSNSKIYSN